MTYGHAANLVLLWCECGRPATVLDDDGGPALCARCANAARR